MGDARHVDGGVTTAAEARLAESGLIAPLGPGALDVRTGVIAGPGSTALVTGTTATGTMTVQINPHVAVTTRGSANGVYLGPVLAAATTANIAAAPGTGSRIDVVYVKQQDSTSGVPSPDVTTAPLYGVLTGTSGSSPAKPSIASIAGAEELATVQVSAGATSTNGAGVTITQTARQTVARGGIIPVRNQTERDAITAYPAVVFRMDTGGLEVHGTSGSWQPVVAGATTSATPSYGAGAFVANSSTPLKITKDQNGLGTLTGLISNNVAVSNVTGVWFTLPVGFRPTAPVIWLAYLEGGGLASYQINTDGTVQGLLLLIGTYPIPTPHYWSFSHSFPVA